MSCDKSSRKDDNEYQYLAKWFKERVAELDIAVDIYSDPLDMNHSYNRDFDFLCKEACQHFTAKFGFSPTPRQLMHAFFQLKDPQLGKKIYL